MAAEQIECAKVKLSQWVTRWQLGLNTVCAAPGDPARLAVPAAELTARPV
jgi:hypothetical protein